ncbi:barstar family protein [Filifactor villosus]|uniref:Barstar family protein n=1 Tax=Filifactor villosus TaxID=29374 RepID=A0ABV9QJR2_9FIRM
MREIHLDGKKMKTAEKTHLYLRVKLDLPYYYGDNLDALWDCLSEISDISIITLENSTVLKKHLGTYADSLIRIFEDYTHENPDFKFEILS